MAPNNKRMIVKPWAGHTKTSEVAKEKPFYGRTTDATPLALLTLEIPLGIVANAEASVAVLDEAGVEHAVYKVGALVKRTAAGVVTVTSIDAWKSESDAALACAFDASGANLRLMATGKAATNLRWAGKFKIVGVQ